MWSSAGGKTDVEGQKCSQKNDDSTPLSKFHEKLEYAGSTGPKDKETPQKR